MQCSRLRVFRDLLYAMWRSRSFAFATLLPKRMREINASPRLAPCMAVGTYSRMPLYNLSSLIFLRGSTSLFVIVKGYGILGADDTCHLGLFVASRSSIVQSSSTRMSSAVTFFLHVPWHALLYAASLNRRRDSKSTGSPKIGGISAYLQGEYARLSSAGSTCKLKWPYNGERCRCSCMPPPILDAYTVWQVRELVGLTSAASRLGLDASPCVVHDPI